MLRCLHCLLRHVRLLAYAWLTGNAVSVAYAVVTGPTLLYDRPSGLTTHPNALGLVCALTGRLSAAVVW